MKKLIYLTGSIESPFFTNEISAFTELYDEVFAISYDGNRETCNKLSEMYHFKYAFIKDSGIRFDNFVNLVKWMRMDYVKDELKTSTGIKQRMYVMFYGIYWSKLNKLISNYVKRSDEIYVYSFWLSRPAFGTACISIEYENVIKAVSRTHRYDLYEEENPLGYLPFRRFITEHLDIIFFSSRDSLEYFTDKGYSTKKLPEMKLSYLGTYDHGIKSVDEQKRKMVVASCSFIIQRKRLDLIIRLVKELSTLIDVKWIHIGDGEIEEDIKTLAKDQLDGECYTFLGRMEDEEIFSTYRQYDVDYFINLSDSEGIPVSVIESLSMGIPVVARNVGGMADAVCPDVGFLIEQDVEIINWKTIAENMVREFSDKNKFKNKRDLARKKWYDQFNAERNPGLVAAEILNDRVDR